MPEKLHLLYPKILAGRLEISNDLRANVEVNDDRTLSTTGPRLIDIDEVRELSQLTLRLEALCSAQSVIRPPPPDSPVMPTSPGMESPSSKRAQLKAIRLPPPAYLGPAIREDMQDDELAGIIESLTTRIENCLSTMVRWSPTVPEFSLTGGIVYQASRRVLIGARGAGTGDGHRSEAHRSCDVPDERGDERMSGNRG